MSPSWRQLNVYFDGRETIENAAATRLAPALASLQEARSVDSWFFMRKTESFDTDRGTPEQPKTRFSWPCWRVRLLTHDETTATEALAVLRASLDPVASVREVIYEPEVRAFGGSAAMTMAHTLFHQDSQHILSYLSRTNITDPVRVGRAELTVLLYSQLFRAAGQDWYEQGDIWERVARNRPVKEPPSNDVRSLRSQLRHLISVDTTQVVDDPASGLAFATDWFTAFDTAGQQLRRLSRDGALRRGIRAVLAHHVLFGFNRMGLSPFIQSRLAHAASSAVFD